MRKIYYTQRCLLLCSPEESAEVEHGFTLMPEGTTAAVATRMLLDSGQDGSIALICNDTALAYEELMYGFKQVNAAGGLVRSDSGEFLVMFRNGVWDLPKGHQEPDEAIEITAEREIAEETGITELRRGDLICITDHCYLRDGIWHLKHTWWYDFMCSGGRVPTPQTEEGISEVKWVTAAEIPTLMENTYPSIREVFEKTDGLAFYLD